MNPVIDAISGDQVVSNPEPTKLETISEVDFSFFLTNPKLPWGSDPFLKQPGYIKQNGPNQDYSLNGIVYSKNIPMAVINGKIVKEGDRVNDRRVSLIGDNFVILKKQDSEIELVMPPIMDEGSDDAEEEPNGEN